MAAPENSGASLKLRSLGSRFLTKSKSITTNADESSVTTAQAEAWLKSTVLAAEETMTPNIDCAMKCLDRIQGRHTL